MAPFFCTMKSELLKRLYSLIQLQKAQKFDAIAAERTKYITVAMENITKEHNASAVMRTCDCFGIQDLHLIEPNKKYKTQREISKGASNWIDTFNYSSLNASKDCINELRSNGYQIIATSPHASKTIDEIDICQPIALVFGTERTGISEEVSSNVDELIKIPMYGFTESFNVSVSVAILLNQLRNRLNDSDLQWKLSEEQQIDLKIKWCTKIINKGDKVVNEIRRQIIEKE